MYVYDVYYLDDIRRDNEYFCYIGKIFFGVFVVKRYETLKNFATFERTKMLAMTICEKMDHSAARGCHLCSEKLNRKK